MSVWIRDRSRWLTFDYWRGDVATYLLIGPFAFAWDTIE